MAATDQFYRKQKTLDVVFAVSCVLMLISTIWMLVQDYNREFKQIQRDFRDVEATLNDRMMLAKLPETKKVDEQLAAVKLARKEYGLVQDKVAEPARDIQAKRAKQDSKTLSLKAVFDAKSSYLVQTRDEISKANAAEKEHFETKKIAEEKQLTTLGAELEAAQKKLEEIDTEYTKEIRKKKYEINYKDNEGKSIKKELSLEEAEKTLSDAEDNLKKMTVEFDRFAKAAAQKTWRFGDTFRNLPILDAFASPTKINQIVLPELLIDYSLKEVPRYDRCTTCHLAIDRASFDSASLRALGDTPSTLSEKLKTAHKILKDRQDAGENLGFDLSDLPTEVRKKKLTKGQVTMYAAHPRLDLFVDTNGAHPMQQFGCTICHAGQGSATDFVLASHSPADTHQEHQWEKTYSWQSNHYWDYPMMSKRFTESSCLKCHHQVADLVRFGSKQEAPKLMRGYDLVRENGCFGCHEISGTKAGRSIGPDLRLEPTPPLDWLPDAEQVKLKGDTLNPPGSYRKVGPSLRRISEKTDQEWVRKWISSPRSFREDTKMPHFYGLSTNSREALKKEREAWEKETGKKDPTPQDDFPDAEIHSIAYYLLSESEGHFKYGDKPADDLSTSRRALREAQQRLQDALKEKMLSDKDKKELDDVTKWLIDLALLSSPWKAADINAAGADVKQLQDRLQELYRATGTEEDTKSAVIKELTDRTKKLTEDGKPISIAKQVQEADGSIAVLEAAVEKADEAAEKTRSEAAKPPSKPRTRAERVAVDGKVLFTTKGCLACHSHEGTESGDTPVVGEANFGPNLSRIKAKIKPEMDGVPARRWLYQWILNPNIHHPRTRMPVTRLTDSEALLVADWLLSQPANGYDEKDPAAPDHKTLVSLARVFLAKAPGITRAEGEECLKETGDIGFEQSKLRFLARDAEEHRLLKSEDKKVTDDDLKWYIGKKSLSRMGCFACHDVPGFEQAKPIGTALNDWGKKDPERLAFEDAESYAAKTFNIVPARQTKKDLEELIKKKDREARVKEILAKSEDDRTNEEKWELADLTTDGAKLREPITEEEKAEVKELRERLAKGPLWGYDKDKAPYEKQFFDALEHHTRNGFLHLKLMEPRSFDYNRARVWDDRLRMPQFQFGRSRKHKDESDDDFKVRQSQEEAEAREAVMTFILGLTAENIAGKYIAKPAGDRGAEVKGRQLLDKYNCIGCHQARSNVFEFKLTDEMRERMTERAKDSAIDYKERYAFPGHNAWTGVAPTSADRLTAFGNFNPGYNPTKSADEAPVRDKHPADKDGRYSIRLNEALRFTDPGGLTRDLPAGERIFLTPADVGWMTDAYGGKFAELMLPYLIKTNSGFDPDKARNVLPPPLHREGERVQPNWVYQFLLNPKTVRPEVVLNMPRFNMSHEEASALVDYFVAVEKLTNPAAGTGTPHVVIPQRDEAFWHHGTQEYLASISKNQMDDRLKALEEVWKENKVPEAKRKELAEEYRKRDAYSVDSYRLLTNVVEKGGACAKCHIVNGKGEKQAPSLDLTAERLRPEWTRRWIANPQAMFSYNPSMPVNIEKMPAGKEKFQDLFHGPSLNQVTALRDVLMDLSRVAGMPANRSSSAAPAGEK